MFVTNQINNASMGESIKMFHAYVKPFLIARMQEIIS